MGQNKSLVSSANTKIDQICPFLWCVKVLDITLLKG